jgi:hypothetical protein
MSGLYEFNFYSFNNVEGLAWFVGPGVHLGFWKDQYQKDYNSKADFGIDGIIGLDYKFRGVPINVSLDWEPSITLVGTAWLHAFLWWLRSKIYFLKDWHNYLA